MVKDNNNLAKKYFPLATAAGLGSLLGSGIIVSLSATLTVWQKGLGLSNIQVGVISGALTFAIAFGSLFGGRLGEKIGLIKYFNWINFFYAIGGLICVLSQNYAMLLIGTVIVGIASGSDLPVSLSVVSRDAPDDKTSSELVAATQIFWQVGIFSSYVCAFLVSKMNGTSGARLVFSILTFFAIITWLWRLLSRKFKSFHDNAPIVKSQNSKKKLEKGIIKSIFGSKKYIYMFMSILVFYCLWNLLANTWGQFQTFMLVKADASQSLATGAGLVLSILGFLLSIGYSALASTKFRNIFFFVGSVIMFIAMVFMALGGTNLWIIIAALALNGVGAQLSGEALYKVWTQESFPVEARSSVQGIINGTSRILCALFAMITPTLVLPNRIKMTMWLFAGLIVISFIAGICMINLQKKYKIRS